MKRTALERTRFYPKRKTPFATRNTPMVRGKRSKARMSQVYLGRTGYTPTKSRQNDWRKWQTRTWAHWLLRNTSSKNIVCMCGCGRVKFHIDHIMPRSNFRGDNWDPCNGQLLHAELNMEKGSQHGPQWDFRPWKYKVYQRYRRRLDWTYNTVTRHWEMNEIKKEPKPL